jgi:Ca2+-binding EF-hand superfamily protein
MTPHILTFSVAHRIDVVKAADDIDTILRRFGYGASETQRVVDVLTAADLKSAVTVEELIETIKIFSNENKKRL